MRSIFIGTVQFSRDCLEHLIQIDAAPVGVITRASSNFHADYAALDELCSDANINLLHVTDMNAETTLSWISELKPDVLFCFGWSQLLKPKILEIAPLGVIGYHPALLPGNRGRHPIIWALALGLQETGSTFFFMDEGADSGDILSQRRIIIEPGDDATTLYAKMTEAALFQITEFVPRLVKGNYQRISQNEDHASYWRKRSLDDGRIDWRMPSLGIHNLVRALKRPYPGATIRRGESDQIIWQTKLNDQISTSADIEPGRVLAVKKNIVEVKTGDSSLLLVDHELKPLPVLGDFL